MNFGLYIAIFLILVLLLAVYVLYSASRKKFSQRDLNFFGTTWKKISANEDGRHAVLDADKLLYEVLRRKGYAGSVGDQLKKAEKLFTNINDVWFAHKMRNRIAHELNVQLSRGDAQHALRCFERALKDLGAL